MKKKIKSAGKRKIRKLCYLYLASFINLNKEVPVPELLTDDEIAEFENQLDSICNEMLKKAGENSTTNEFEKCVAKVLGDRGQTPDYYSDPFPHKRQ